MAILCNKISKYEIILVDITASFNDKPPRSNTDQFLCVVVNVLTGYVHDHGS
jgi:hypothetical protein